MLLPEQMKVSVDNNLVCDQGIVTQVTAVLQYSGQHLLPRVATLCSFAHNRAEAVIIKDCLALLNCVSSLTMYAHQLWCCDY